MVAHVVGGGGGVDAKRTRLRTLGLWVYNSSQCPAFRFKQGAPTAGWAPTAAPNRFADYAKYSNSQG
eukprot:9484955-Pyramimonas_sp.AAC.1